MASSPRVVSAAQLRALAAKKPSKYGAQSSGGHASKKEHRRALQLRQLQSAGEISGLREQVPFVLIPSQRGPGGRVVERSCRYVADFVYTDSSGALVVEDSKGFRTDAYIIKRKLMLYIHGIRILET